MFSKDIDAVGRFVLDLGQFISTACLECEHGLCDCQASVRSSHPATTCRSCGFAAVCMVVRIYATWHAVANVGSAMLSACVGSWTPTYKG